MQSNKWKYFKIIASIFKCKLFLNSIFLKLTIVYSRIETFGENILSMLFQFKAQFDNFCKKEPHDENEVKLYYDYMRSLMSIYVDLQLIFHSKNNKKKSIKKIICSNIFYLLGKSLKNIFGNIKIFFLLRLFN